MKWVRLMSIIDDQHQAVLLAPWRGDHRPHMFTINKNNTGTGNTEVHVLSPSSDYRTYVLHAKTELHATDASWHFRLADWDGDGIPDLWAIRTKGSGTKRVEVHILSGASNFSTFIAHEAIALGEFDNDLFTFDVITTAVSPKPNLVAFKRHSTGTSSTEIHVLSGASNFQLFTEHVSTALHETGPEWQLLMTDWNGNGSLDLVAVTPRNGGEVHVIGGPTFKDFSLHAQAESAKQLLGSKMPEHTWEAIKSCTAAVCAVLASRGSSVLPAIIAAIEGADCYRSIVKYVKTEAKNQSSGGSREHHFPDDRPDKPGESGPTGHLEIGFEVHDINNFQLPEKK